jgi:hypothetical protein
MDNRVAAVWARVSTPGQKDPSLDGQVERAKAKLETMGYVPKYVFKAVWTSADLKPCPEFQELRRLVQTKQIQAVGMLDRDRIEAHGLQRLNFLADCKSNGVEPIVHQGVPFLEGPEGQLVELALALAKEKQLERASSGAKQGLEDRAKGIGKFKREMPPTKREVFGYKWVGDKDGGKYAPGDNYDGASLIYEVAQSGTKLKPTCKELIRRGIVTRNGKLIWQPSSVRAILTNPIYAGRVATLKYEKVLPKKRRKNKSGKTSHREKPIEAWHFIDGLVERPIVTWEVWLSIQERLKLNKQYSVRHTKPGRFYLLRGLIECQLCNRHFSGVQPSSGKPKYFCTNRWAISYGPKCPAAPFDKEEIEEQVKLRVRNFLESPQAYLQEMGGRLSAQEQTKADAECAIKDLEMKYRETIDHERKQVRLLSEEAFKEEQHLILAKRTYIKEEIERQKTNLDKLQKFAVNVETVETLRERLQHNLDKASNEDWRHILEALGTKILAFGDGTWDIELNIPSQIANKIGSCTCPYQHPVIHQSPAVRLPCVPPQKTSLQPTERRLWSCRAGQYSPSGDDKCRQSRNRPASVSTFPWI